MPPRMQLCSKLWQSLTMCSPVLACPSPCRSFQSDKDPSSSLHAILLVWTSSLCQELLKIMHNLFLCQTCVPQTLWTSQATSNSQKPWNSISIYFIEKLPPSSSYTSILVIVDHLSKQALFIPTHDTIMSPQLAQLLILHVFSKHSVPSH